jgi:hypothetical protein
MGAWLGQFKEAAAQATVIAAWLAATAALVGALVSYLVARRGVYINSVTTERSRWIEALRATISKLSGAASKLHASRNTNGYINSTAHAADLEVLRTHLVELTLRINPTEDEAQGLLLAANKLDRAARLHAYDALTLADEVMTLHAQWVLKAEWERVKQEASGFLAQPYFWWRNWRRSVAYEEFLTGEGSLVRLDVIGAGTWPQPTRVHQTKPGPQ